MDNVTNNGGNFADLEVQLTPTQLRNITGSEDLKEVTKLEICVDSIHITLSDLSLHLPNLVELKFGRPTFLPSLRKLGSLNNLKILWASAVGLQNIDGASGMQNITELYLSYNRISELSPLTYLPNLEVLDLESNSLDSDLELRYLSFCPNLKYVSFAGCPVSSSPDYRNNVLKRLPGGSLLDDAPYSHEEPNDLEMDLNTINSEDATLLKELFSDGLLNEDELLENELLTRPLTSMGICSKITPFNSRPSTAISRKPAYETSPLTTGSVIQGPSGLIRRKAESARTERRSKHQSCYLGIEKETQAGRYKERSGCATEKFSDQININLDESLRSSISESSSVENISEVLEPENGFVPRPPSGEKNTTLQSSIRHKKIGLESSRKKKDFSGEPIKKPSRKQLDSSLTIHVVSKKRELKELRGVRRVDKLTPIPKWEDLNVSRVQVTNHSSRQEKLLAETKEYKQVVSNAPVISVPHSRNQSYELSQN